MIDTKRTTDRQLGVRQQDYPIPYAGQSDKR